MLHLGSANRRFHGLDYVVTASQSTDFLSIEVHSDSAGHWGGRFNARFIEEVTQRTGSFKSFTVFCKMLVTGLTGDSESVSLDILTTDDLEKIRSNQSKPSSRSTLSSNDKRYLILTYQSEFDKVHYPLALSSIQDPPVLSRQHSTPQNPHHILTAPMVAPDSSSYDLEFENLKQDLLDTKFKLSAANKEIDRLSRGSYDEMITLRQSVNYLETELKQFRDSRLKLIAKHRKEVEDLQHQISTCKHSERQLKLKIKQLEIDLSTASTKGHRTLGPPPPPPIQRGTPSRPRSLSPMSAPRNNISRNTSPLGGVSGQTVSGSGPQTYPQNYPQSRSFNNQPTYNQVTPSREVARKNNTSLYIASPSHEIRSFTRSPSPSRYNKNNLPIHQSQQSPSQRALSPYSRPQAYNGVSPSKVSRFTESPIRCASPTRPHSSPSRPNYQKPSQQHQQHQQPLNYQHDSSNHSHGQSHDHSRDHSNDHSNDHLNDYRSNPTIPPPASRHRQPQSFTVKYSPREETNATPIKIPLDLSRVDNSRVENKDSNSRVDIKDIDARLQALQNFLRQTKLAGGA